MTDLRVRVIRDLETEGDELDELVAGLADDAWATDTPSVGWSIAHQVAHLAWTDDMALLALRDPEGFQRLLPERAPRVTTVADETAAEGASARPADLLARWRSTRAEVAAGLLQAPAETKVPWFGPPMSPTSMATARLMETWAHGLDVADALGAERKPTERLRHVAHLGVRTRDFAYYISDLTPPGAPFRVELTAPSGEVWAWGPTDADARVAGPAYDFCLLVTQRRHRDDLALTAVGEADRWLDIAQVFAGLPGTGRPPRGS
ncbi:MAG: TIGR03084 family metal-binding protein [Nocardioidaceae bacterium]